MGWRQPVAKIESFRVHGVALGEICASIYTLQNVQLTQTATLYILQGGSLAQLFDGTVFPPTTMPGMAYRTRPFLLVRSEFPDLASPVPGISQVMLAKLEKVDPTAPLDDVRKSLFLHCCT